VRQILTNEGPNRVVPLKEVEVPFGGPNDVILNFGGKTPPKNWNFGAWIVLSSLNDKKFVIITWKLLSRSWRNLYRGTHYAPRISLRGWSHGSSQQIKMAAAAILNFEKNVNNSGLDKDICIKFYGKTHHGHAEMTTWPKFDTGS